MTVITQTNARDERTQISNALTSVESDVSDNTTDIATNTSAISALDTRITDLEGGVDGTPPTSLSGRRTTNAQLFPFYSTNRIPAPAVSASTSTYDSWETVVSESSKSGVINFLAFWMNTGDNSSNLDTQVSLLIDGTEVYLSDADLYQSDPAASTKPGVPLIGQFFDIVTI